jgi:D-alanyl-D-alanine carboxypeptidase
VQFITKSEALRGFDRLLVAWLTSLPNRFAKKVSVMKKWMLLAFLYGVFSHYALTQPSIASPVDSLLEVMESVLSTKGNRPVPNFMIFAENHSSGFRFHEGVGVVGRNDDPIGPNYQFRVASITKTFVAVVMLQMMEEGDIDLDAPILPFIQEVAVIDTATFMLLDEENVLPEVTVRQLLNHTSGIADVFKDKATRFTLSVLLRPRRSWNKYSIIERYYKYKLNRQPHNRPGAGYYYSDTNYMLLGYIIERLSGNTLAEEIRDRILTPLNLKHTYFEYYEPAVEGGGQIDAFYNRINTTKKLNTSYEWAGGGLVSTTQDLAIFIRSLFLGKLFSEKPTLEKMMDIQETKPHGGNYGLGLISYDVADRRWYGHGGFFGSLMLYDPQDDYVFVANVGQANAPFDAEELVGRMLRIGQ